MPFGETSCSHYGDVGHSPFPYFLMGILELIFLLLLYIFIKRSRHLASRGFRGASNLLVLPLYHLIIQYILLIGLFVCIVNIFGIYEKSPVIIAIKWFCYRTCAEGVAVLFMHNGVGFKALRNSMIVGSTWGLFSSVFPLLVYLSLGFDSYAVFVLILGACLLLFYTTVWLAPTSLIHRRPALIGYARFYTCFISCFIIVIVLLMDEEGWVDCISELCLLIIDLVQPFIIFHALQIDSMYWQGLYAPDDNIDSNGNTQPRKWYSFFQSGPSAYKSSINAPLLGIWDLGRETIGMVTDSIAMLERKVVPVIPFGTINGEK